MVHFSPPPFILATWKPEPIFSPSFSAKDNVRVTGYLVTQTSTKPLATDSRWQSTPQRSYIFTTAGSKTLYAWAKDAAGNVSASKSATVLIDTARPIVTAFTIPATSTSLTVPITKFTATDNVLVTGYLVTDSSTVPPVTDPGWTSTPPTSYKSSTWGAKTLYAWAKDAAGNISTPRSAPVNIVDKTPPTVTAFTVPPTSASLTVPITKFTATDNVKVTGYLVTQTSTKPSAAPASGWTATPPTSYKCATAGNKTLYAWAKDASGNVSASKSAKVSISISAVRLPRTGQTATYGTRDDGALNMGVAWPVPRFKDNANGTVTDNLTGLIWLKNANCTDTVGGIDKSHDILVWADALTWSNNLASSACGLTDGSKAGDWRLPNRKELMSLIDRSKYSPALPADHPFSNVQAYSYWSSSSYAYSASYAWCVGMSGGGVSESNKSYSNYVWPVRSGQ
jgi:hypothetical protein